MNAIQVLVEVLHSPCHQFFCVYLGIATFAVVNVREAHATCLSTPSGIMWDSTAPSPYGLASHDRVSGSSSNTSNCTLFMYMYFKCGLTCL